MEYINPHLRHLATPIASLHEDPENPNSHDNRDLRVKAEALRKFGQQKDIVATPEGKVIAGNGIFLAARDILGWSHIACSRFDKPGRVQERGYAIADNRTNQLAGWNFKALSERLKSYQSEGEDLSLLGWADHDLDPLFSADWTERPPGSGVATENPGNKPAQSYPLSEDQRCAVEQATTKLRDELEDHAMNEGRALVVLVERYMERRDGG